MTSSVSRSTKRNDEAATTPIHEPLATTEATASVWFELVTLREAHGYSQRRCAREADEAATTALVVVPRAAIDHCAPGHDSAPQ